MKIRMILLLIIFTNNYFLFSQESFDKVSIEALIEKAKNETSDINLSESYLSKAYALVQQIENDSLKTTFLIKVAYRYLKNDNDRLFRRINHEARQLSLEIKDTLMYAETFWDLGVSFTNKSINDSAYFAYNLARKYYAGSGDQFSAGKMLLNMAIAQTKIKDFSGSEKTTIQALDIFLNLNKRSQIFKCYNNLGVVSKELNEYDEAINYYNKASEYADKDKMGAYIKASTLNNIGVVYSKQGKYKKALDNFTKALSEKQLKEERLSLYAKLIDNMAYSKLKLGDTLGVHALFNESLDLRKKANDFEGIASNHLHLADYHLIKVDTAKVIATLLETRDLAKKKEIFVELLKSIKMLTQIDKINSPAYALEYISLNDSLQIAERQIRDKFIKIQFETDEHITRNTQLVKKNRRQLWIAGIVLLLTSLLFIIRNQRIRFKNLQLEREQQASNEEIYEIMLQQQEQIEVSKNDEKRRISEELHDGVLGKLFGTRLLLDTLNDSTDPESVLQREKHIQELQEIEEEVRNVSHELHEKSQAINISYVQLIEKLLKEKALQGNFNYDLKIDKKINWTDIDNTLKMNLYRILQESLQNITKYAKANTVIVKLELIAERLLVEVKDDGVGFIPEKKVRGIGHKNIASRIKKMQGNFQIESAPSEGTKILLEIPV